MSNLVEQIADRLSSLSFEKQQMVLEFADFLSQQSKSAIAVEPVSPKPSTFYDEVVSQYIGCVDSGHTDLSTNKAHMEGFGKV